MIKLSVIKENKVIIFENIQVTIKKEFGSIACLVKKLGNSREYIKLEQGIVQIDTLNTDSITIIPDCGVIAFCALDHLIKFKYIGRGIAIIKETGKPTINAFNCGIAV